MTFLFLLENSQFLRKLTLGNHTVSFLCFAGDTEIAEKNAGKLLPTMGPKHQSL